MIVACSACDNRFSAVGYRDVTCPACGAFAQRPADRPCPRCNLPLAARTVGDLVIDECSGCLGLFLDHVAIDRVIEDRELTRAETLLAALPRRSFSALPPQGGKMYVKCPACNTVMNRKLFATSGVVVDVCRAHGMYFDAGELPAIIDFVMTGGLDKATAKNEAQQRAQERRGQPPLRPGDTGYESTALVDFFINLFDG